MDKLKLYREYIQNILKEKADLMSKNSSLETQLIFDRERDHYQLLKTGWKNDIRFYGVNVHVDIKGEKILIQQDNNEEAIADQLVRLGVPKKDIILAYHAPYLRQYTEFAVD